MEIVKGFQLDEFDRLAFNVARLDAKTPVLSSFPALAAYPEFHYEVDGADTEQVLRYILLIYQANTPLSKIDNLIKRKIEAARIVGWETDENGYFAPAVDAILKCMNVSVNQMVIRLLRIQNNTKFAALIIGTEAYYNKLSKIMDTSSVSSRGSKTDPEIEKIKGHLWEQALKMEKDLNTLAMELLNEDNNPYLRRDLFCTIEQEQFQTILPTPENFAKGETEAV